LPKSDRFAGLLVSKVDSRIFPFKKWSIENVSAGVFEGGQGRRFGGNLGENVENLSGLN
jgi:hypothetical protein